MKTIYLLDFEVGEPTLFLEFMCFSFISSRLYFFVTIGDLFFSLTSIGSKLIYGFSFFLLAMVAGCESQQAFSCCFVIFYIFLFSFLAYFIFI